MCWIPSSDQLHIKSLAFLNSYLYYCFTRETTRNPACVTRIIKPSFSPRKASSSSQLFVRKASRLASLSWGLKGNRQNPIGCGSKLSRRGYAGFGLCFYLPGFHFGTGFSSHKQLGASGSPSNTRQTSDIRWPSAPTCTQSPAKCHEAEINHRKIQPWTAGR